MRKLAVLLMVLLAFSPIMAHSDYNYSDPESVQDPSTDSGQNTVETGFSQLYAGSGSAAVWVLAEVVVALGVTAFSVRHYVRKSESSSLKEFIRDVIL